MLSTVEELVIPIDFMPKLKRDSKNMKLLTYPLRNRQALSRIRQQEMEQISIAKSSSSLEQSISGRAKVIDTRRSIAL